MIASRTEHARNENQTDAVIRIEALAEDFATYAATDNAHFNRARFLNACGHSAILDLARA